MKVATYFDGGPKVGILSADETAVYPLREFGCDCADMVDFIEMFDETMRAAIAGALAEGEPGIPLSEVTLLAPIPQPRHDILCVGQNYLAHALESAKFKGEEYKKPEHPLIFTKRVRGAVAPEGAIPAHADFTSQVDYEAELAVIIGRKCDHVEPERVFDHLFGYTVVNDVSARDLQSRYGQFAVGKSLDGFTAMGPWIALESGFERPPRLRVATRVNGEPRQDGNTSDFIFDIPRLVSELSRGITLDPGDIIITGTPAGVGLGFNPPRFLKPGDVVECEIEGIGMLRNRVE